MEKVITYIVYLLIAVQMESSGACDPVQYADLWGVWTANCSFPVEFSSVYWYDSLENNIDPVLRYERDVSGNFVASGEGYFSGQYKIQSTGSLVIPNVTIENERTYKAILLDDQHSVIDSTILLKTRVSPLQTFPHVPGCEERTCVITYHHCLVLSCSINQVRPPANLSWHAKTADGEEQLFAPQITSPDGYFTYTSAISINITNLNVKPVMELFCRVSGIHSKYLLEDTLILIDNSVNLWNEQNPRQIIRTDVSMNHPAFLSCTFETKPITFIWKQIKNNESIVLAFSTRNEGQVHVTSNHRMDVSNEGVISFNHCDLTCEGRYICVYTDGKTLESSSHQMILFIGPTPSYLLVDGCSPGLQKCEIHLSSLDQLKNLTCSVQNVYPRLSLNFASDHPMEMTVSNQRHVVARKGTTYDVTVKGELRLLKTFNCHNLHTVTCAATGPASTSFIPYKTIEVSYDQCHQAQIPNREDGVLNQNTALIVLGVVIIILLTAGIAVFVSFKLYHIRQRPPRNVPNQSVRNGGEEIANGDDFGVNIPMV